MQFASDEPDDAAVSRFLAIIAMVPPATRRFTVPSTVVPRTFGLRAELLTRMVGLGLPSAEKDGVAYFERSDLVNMSVRLRTGTRYLAIRRFWPRAIRALEGKSQTGYGLSYVASCPAAQPHPGCRFRVLTPRGPVERACPAGQPGPVYTTDVWLSCEWPELPAIAREVVDIAEKFELTWLPLALRTDTGFMRATGLANCIGLSRILAAESRQRGLRARSVFGFLASPPYGNVHFWAEVRVEDLWVPIDPMMITTMIGWDVLDPTAWTPYRSLGGILCKLGSRSRPLVTHDRKKVAASFLVSHL